MWLIRTIDDHVYDSCQEKEARLVELGFNVQDIQPGLDWTGLNTEGTLRELAIKALPTKIKKLVKEYQTEVMYLPHQYPFRHHEILFPPVYIREGRVMDITGAFPNEEAIKLNFGKWTEFRDPLSHRNTPEGWWNEYVFSHDIARDDVDHYRQLDAEQREEEALDLAVAQALTAPDPDPYDYIEPEPKPLKEDEDLEILEVLEEIEQDLRNQEELDRIAAQVLNDPDPMDIDPDDADFYSKISESYGLEDYAETEFYAIDQELLEEAMSEQALNYAFDDGSSPEPSPDDEDAIL